MHKFLLCVFLLFSTPWLSAGCSDVPAAVRQAYAADFYQAFVIQSNGGSTAAICQFQVAYEAAKKAGESIQRLVVIEQLFGWYRMYGSSLKLFYRNPTGHDRIIGEYQTHSLKSPGYQSEWGKTPDQAATIREFMLGVGETISGVFCITVGGSAALPIGTTLFLDGCRRMILTLNSAWTEHQKALLALQEWEARSKPVVGSD